MTEKRQVFFNPVSGELRLDLPYPDCQNIPNSIYWPNENQRGAKEVGFKNLTLAITMNCNLACDYCWQKHEPDNNIDASTINKWLDYFLDEKINSPSKILYYGGEPLLRPDLVQLASNEAKRLCKIRGIKLPKQHLFTNGTLLTDDMIQFLDEAGIFAIISIDGDKASNDLHRLSSSRKSVYDQVMEGIGRLSDRGVAFGICCTISDPAFDVDSTVGYLLNQADPQTFELNLRHDKDFRAVAQRYQGAYLDSFTKAWELLERWGITNVDLRKRVMALADRVPLQNSSSGSKNKLSVMPNGNISSYSGAVSFPELQISPSGNWVDFFEARWSRNALIMDSCKTCNAAYLCGQGSAFSSFLQYGDFDHVPALHCEYCNTVLTYIMNRMAMSSIARNAPLGYVFKRDDYLNEFVRTI